MKKGFIRVIVCLLAVCMVFATACKNKDNGNNSSGSSKVLYKDGTHIFNVGTTEHKILVDGATDYKIVIPTGATGFVFDAAQDLRTILQEATGANFDVLSND